MKARRGSYSVTNAMASNMLHQYVPKSKSVHSVERVTRRVTAELRKKANEPSLSAQTVEKITQPLKRHVKNI